MGTTGHIREPHLREGRLGPDALDGRLTTAFDANDSMNPRSRYLSSMRKPRTALVRVAPTVGPPLVEKHSSNPGLTTAWPTCTVPPPFAGAIVKGASAIGTKANGAVEVRAFMDTV